MKKLIVLILLALFIINPSAVKSVSPDGIEQRIKLANEEFVKNYNDIINSKEILPKKQKKIINEIRVLNCKLDKITNAIPYAEEYYVQLARSGELNIKKCTSEVEKSDPNVFCLPPTPQSCKILKKIPEIKTDEKLLNYEPKDFDYKSTPIVICDVTDINRECYAILEQTRSKIYYTKKVAQSFAQNNFQIISAQDEGNYYAGKIQDFVSRFKDLSEKFDRMASTMIKVIKSATCTCK